MHRTHSFAVLSLVVALVAGLACDDNALTETPAPAGPSAPGVDEDPNLAVDDITAMGTIPLPINQSVATTAPAPAFRVNQTGTGPNGIFQITRSGSTQTALQGLTNGRGRAGVFRITNTANTGAALEAQTNGLGYAVQGVATGGGGGAGRFQVTNANSSALALNVSTAGVENAAARFESNHPDNGGWAVEISSSFLGGGLIAQSRGNSPAGSFSHQASAPDASPALYVASPAPNAAWFDGNVRVNGTLTKNAGSFKIEHPLDPERKYLSHSFVESPDMMNVYNGNATLDENGRATVELPDYFEALNKDFRYQLTAIGAPGPNLYIAEGVKQNRFKIAGGRPYASVSWQVTGIRQDTYANEHRIKVEEDKPAEEQRGADRLVARR